MTNVAQILYLIFQAYLITFNIMSKEETGYYGSLTEEQTKALVKIKADTVNMNNTKWKYDLGLFDDYDYLRFLRARKFDLVKTLEMIDKYIMWRIESKVDQILVLIEN